AVAASTPRARARAHAGSGSPARQRAIPCGILPVSDIWSPTGTYLNTPSYGLPPQPAWDALQAVLADWHGGRTGWREWGDPVEGAREAFAALVGVDRSQVAIGANVSGLAALVAGSLPAGTRGVLPDVEFTST